MDEFFQKLPNGSFRIARAYQQRLQDATERSSRFPDPTAFPGSGGSSQEGAWFTVNPELIVWAEITAQPDPDASPDPLTGYSWRQRIQMSEGEWVVPAIMLAGDNGTEDSGTTVATITNAGVQDGLAAFITDADHDFAAGDRITIAAMPSPFTALNGTFQILETPTSTTFGFLTTEGNIAVVATSGTATRAGMARNNVAFDPNGDETIPIGTIVALVRGHLHVGTTPIDSLPLLDPAHPEKGLLPDAETQLGQDWTIIGSSGGGTGSSDCTATCFDNIDPHSVRIVADVDPGPCTVKQTWNVVQYCGDFCLNSTACPQETIATLTNMEVLDGIVTLTTSADHSASVGNTVTLSSLPSPFTDFNSSFEIVTVPTPTTFTFATEQANIASASASGSVGRDVSGCTQCLKVYDRFHISTIHHETASGIFPDCSWEMDGYKYLHGCFAVSDVPVPGAIPVIKAGTWYYEIGADGCTPVVHFEIVYIVANWVNLDDHSLTIPDNNDAILVPVTVDSFTAASENQAIIEDAMALSVATGRPLQLPAGTIWHDGTIWPDETMPKLEIRGRFGKTILAKSTIGGQLRVSPLNNLGYVDFFLQTSDPKTLRLVYPSIEVTNKSLTSNIVTLTTADEHHLSPGDPFQITDIDATFNSAGYEFLLDTPTSTTLRYRKTASNVASSGASGTLTLFRNGEVDSALYERIGVGDALPIFQQGTQGQDGNYGPRGMVVVTGKEIVPGSPDHYLVTVDEDIPQNVYTVSNKALTSNVATITTSAPHGLLRGWYANVYGVDATFDGTHVVTSVPTATTFTYAKTASNVGSTGASGNMSYRLGALKWMKGARAITATVNKGDRTFTLDTAEGQDAAALFASNEEHYITGGTFVNELIGEFVRVDNVLPQDDGTVNVELGRAAKLRSYGGTGLNRAAIVPGPWPQANLKDLIFAGNTYSGEDGGLTYIFSPNSQAENIYLGPSIDGALRAQISNKALTSNVATITTAVAHGLTTGNVVRVKNVGEPFDGSAISVTVTSSTTFTYSATHANVASAAATGQVYTPIYPHNFGNSNCYNLQVRNGYFVGVANSVGSGNTFTNCYISDMTFEEISDGATFVGCELTGSLFGGTSFTNVRFDGCTFHSLRYAYSFLIGSGGIELKNCRIYGSVPVIVDGARVKVDGLTGDGGLILYPSTSDPGGLTNNSVSHVYLGSLDLQLGTHGFFEDIHCTTFLYNPADWAHPVQNDELDHLSSDRLAAGPAPGTISGQRILVYDNGRLVGYAPVYDAFHDYRLAEASGNAIDGSDDPVHLTEHGTLGLTGGQRSGFSGSNYFTAPVEQFLAPVGGVINIWIWVYPTLASSGSYQIIASTREDFWVGNVQWWLQTNTTDLFELAIYGESGEVSVCAATTAGAFIPNALNLVRMQIDDEASVMSLWVNGQAYGSPDTAVYGQRPNVPTGNFWLGRAGDFLAGPFSGRMGPMTVLNRRLTSAEHTAIWNGGVPTTWPASLQGYSANQLTSGTVPAARIPFTTALATLRHARARLSGRLMGWR